MSRVLPQRSKEASSYLDDDDSSMIGSKTFTPSRPSLKERPAAKERRQERASKSLRTGFDSEADTKTIAQVDLSEIPRVKASLVYSVPKRAMDICGAMVGFALFGPLMAVCALLIKWQDGGPILYCQSRVGERGESFSILKFRSMVVNADEIRDELSELNSHSDDRTFKILNDPRITPVGRFMRRLSLDELPQFWNVLTGDMSLVGPRPALPDEVAIYERRDLIRLAVRPGLTCIWQVSGRSNLDFTRQRQLDAEYIRRRSLWLDTVLILKTAPAVFRGDGAA